MSENMLDRLERMRAEPTKGITDPGAGDYSLLLLRMAPDLIAAARALGEVKGLLWSPAGTVVEEGDDPSDLDWCASCGDIWPEVDNHDPGCPVPAALSAWERVQ